MAQYPMSPETTPRTRAKARHILDNYYIGPARDDAVLEIWGYTPRMSYAVGENVSLHVSTTAPAWDLEVGRDGLAYEPLLSETACPVGIMRRRKTARCAVAAGLFRFEFAIPDTWAPGVIC